MHVTIYKSMAFGVSFMRIFPATRSKRNIFRPHRSRRAFLFAVSSIGAPYQPCCRCISLRYSASLRRKEYVCFVVGSVG
jgi:hypothetical protein